MEGWLWGGTHFFVRIYICPVTAVIMGLNQRQLSFLG